MSDSSPSSSSYDSAIGPPEMGNSPASSRQWRDIFWSVVFILHLMVMGFALVVFGLSTYRRSPQKYPPSFSDNRIGTSTLDIWRFYAVACGVGTILGSLIGLCANQFFKFSIHLLTTYLAVISVLCFWRDIYFLGAAFAICALCQFLYVISVIDRLPFTMLVLKRATKILWKIPKVLIVASIFMLFTLSWLALWSFGASGVIAFGFFKPWAWFFLMVLSSSLFWTGAVLCNAVHVVISGIVYHVIIHGGRESESIPVMSSLRYAVTTSFGSICYGSLFTAFIRMLRWEIRGLRSKIGDNECLLCCVDFLFHLVEFLVRWFNKYAYVQIAVSGKSFNNSAKDAWELFQSTGIETIIAYDCSGAVLFMGSVLGGLISGTCSSIWTKICYPDRVAMIGLTSALMGSILVGMAMVVVESAVTSIYVCFAEDPSLIHRWDSAFHDELSEKLHQRLQHRSARDGREVFDRRRIEAQIREAAFA